MDLIQKLNIPKECLVNNVIPKKDFFEQNMKTTERNLFTNNVKQIKWLYSLKEENINIKKYIDEEKEYLEIEIIQLTLKKEQKQEKITEIIQKFIPYPILLIIRYKNRYKLSLAHKRNNKNDTEQIIITETINTNNWIKENFTKKQDEKLIQTLNIKNLNTNNFYEMYEDMINTIIRYNATNEIKKEINKPIKEIKEITNQITQLDKKINELKKEQKKETQFNKKVEQNIEIQKLKDKKEKLEKELKGE
ncbi:MAG: DUF4391 domain-containing protein [Methanobacteriaceae archaeon]|nr:DUF4391 domain-containing protein [Methanobacteriaceae archaeon]